MKKQSLSISIPEPCHEKWSEMTPVEQGRHCLSCQKTVVDFTKMPKVKIAEFVSQNEARLCGRFTSDQLNVELMPPKPSKSWFKYAAIVLGLIPSISFGQKTEDVRHVEPIHQSAETKGEVVPSAQHLKHGKQRLLKGKMVDADTGEDILFGTIMVFGKNGLLITGVETDLEGKFEIEVPEGARIEGRYIGYEPNKIEYNALQFDKPFKIKLKAQFLGEAVAVVGLMVPNDSNENVKQNNSEKVLKGQLIDRNSKEPILFGTIAVYDENDEVVHGVESDLEGKFEISVPEGAKVKANYIGYDPETIPFDHINFNKEIKIELQQGYHLTGITVINKESWIERNWKKFKEWVIKSHTSSVKNQEALSAQKNDSIDHIQQVEIKDGSETTSKVILAPSKFRIYPNPTAEMLQLDLPDHITDCSLYISNMENELVLSRELDTNQRSLDISHLVSGSYMVSVISEEELVYSEVIIKQ